MLYICYYVIVIVIFYSQYAQVPWNFLYAFYVKKKKKKKKNVFFTCNFKLIHFVYKHGGGAYI